MPTAWHFCFGDCPTAEPTAPEASNTTVSPGFCPIEQTDIGGHPRHAGAGAVETGRWVELRARAIEHPPSAIAEDEVAISISDCGTRFRQPCHPPSAARRAGGT
jgi:hypothetical protein